MVLIKEFHCDLFYCIKTTGELGIYSTSPTPKIAETWWNSRAMWERFSSFTIILQWRKATASVMIKFIQIYPYRNPCRLCMYIYMHMCVCPETEGKSFHSMPVLLNLNFPIRWPSVGHPHEGALANHPYRNRSKQSNSPFIPGWWLSHPS